ncbi:MAG: bacteriocin [Firmicutes bacterium]|nr:bacteriocin [Bacillota bacterium]
MEAEATGIAASQGIWVLLFVALLLCWLKKNDQRENKLHEIIGRLFDKLNIVEYVQKDVEIIKEKLEG